MKQSALLEETTTFDPSASSGAQEDADSHGSSERAHSWHGDAASTSAPTEDTDLTSLSHAVEGLQVEKERNDGLPFNEQWGEMSLDDKTRMLQAMFPTVKSVDVAYMIKKSGSNYDYAVENLLNQAFLENEVDDTGEAWFKRGIDGFSAPSNRSRGKKKKGKKGHLQRRTSSTPSPLEPRTSTDMLSPSSRWDRAKEDVDFIATRTYVPRSAITSVYHKNGASLPATIAAVLRSDNFENPYLFNISPMILEKQAAELATAFPNFQSLQTRALVQLTYPSTASAHELARALSSSTHASADTQIMPKYLPRPESPTTTPTPSSLSAHTFPSRTTDNLAATRSHAYNQASSAYRLSKSKPLMGGAAAYYSSVARDASVALRQRGAAEAEALVSSQSRPGEIDLHGVNVRDAVSIAGQRVGQWWEKEGREWAREGKVRDGGLRIVTGKGQHSEGGKGKLGPAIGAMLVREGWKVEVGQGVIDVVGKARR